LLPVVCGYGDLKSEAGGDTITLAYAKEDVEVNKKEIPAADAKADELMAPAIDEQRKLREALDLRQQQLKLQSNISSRIAKQGLVGMAMGAAFGYISLGDISPAMFIGAGLGYLYGYLTRHRVPVDQSKTLEL
jgi:hypothetical protein